LNLQIIPSGHEHSSSPIPSEQHYLSPFFAGLKRSVTHFLRDTRGNEGAFTQNDTSFLAGDIKKLIDL
jgi:hypothetical protein